MTCLQNLATRISYWQTPRWMRNGWIAVLSSWIVLAALSVMTARYFKHPLFFFMRGVETPLLLTAALLCGWWARRDFAAATTWQRALAALPPLFVMADQEGGEVSHLSPMLKPMPALATLVTDAGANLEKRARAYGVEQGRELAEIGINMNLAPVVDLRIPLQGKWLNLHTRIDQRAIAEDPEIVARVATAYGRGLAACGVQPTVKHFPGIGRLRADTHLVQASLQSSPGEQAADWLPFREVTANTGAAMMLSHVRLPDIDAKKPASLSRVVVQEVLRRADGKGWNYQGLLITDDLNMGAVYGEGIGRAAISALNAGVDLILVSYDPDQYYRALFEADKSWRGGGVNEATEADSAARIRRYWHEKRPAACSM